VDVFQIQQRLVSDYTSYVESFVNIRDQHIRKFVESEYRKGKYWPEPLLQLNPAFETASSVGELAANGLLHPPSAQVFRSKSDGSSLMLYRHQEEAIRVAGEGHSYVLTTGTGSGKSLSYFIPIVDRIFRQGPRRGLRAIVVYPMNALLNSQLEELESFLGNPDSSPISWRPYTGQEGESDRNAIRANPPDILLTNYVMLELMLTRAEDAPLLKKIEQSGSLEFLVLDEMHTYRGRQGADVAMLVRRLRERTGVTRLQCVGTSATMSNADDPRDRRTAVAEVATKLFGSEVSPDHVIGETLRPHFTHDGFNDSVLTSAVVDAARNVLPSSESEILANPLAEWIEEEFGVRRGADGFERAFPQEISRGARHLAERTQINEADCATAIKSMLLRGSEILLANSNRPVFAFRLHQFISRGDTVFATLDRGLKRGMTLEGQSVLPQDTTRYLYPLAFCRNCGEDYFVVDRVDSRSGSQLKARDFRDFSSKDENERSSGYIWLDSGFSPGSEYLPFDFTALDRLPDEYLTTRANGEVTPSRDIRKRIQAAEIDDAGGIRLTDADGPSPAWFIQGRLPFCLSCGEKWEQGASEFTKLGTLASEGRAGATTLITLKLVQALRAADGIDDKAKKVLSFTDNRQDASLQAGHFNDFVVTSMLRAGILAAIPIGGTTTFDRLPSELQQRLNLPYSDYGAHGDSDPGGKKRAREALRDVLAYRVFRDLRRGWRINQPNLEQLKLLTIEYSELADLAKETDFWQRDFLDVIEQLKAKHGNRGDWTWLYDDGLPAMLGSVAGLSPSDRQQLLELVLNHFRREVAIDAPVLREHEQSSLRDKARTNLNSLWGFDPNEELEPARMLRVSRAQRRGGELARDITPRSRLGQGVAKAIRHGNPDIASVSLDQRMLLLHLLTRALKYWGFLVEPNEDQQFLLSADVLLWRRNHAELSGQVNGFFHDFYQTLAAALPEDNNPVNIRGLHAREHTAQVPGEMRVRREQEFRSGTLPVLYSSPTMELGIDISSLNAVNMRNVPPTPANYAQRGGRAGRANQPAIVVTYCAANSPHDQYYFERRDKMVAGVVTPPRIDLANRDLIASHLHAVWLAETGARLESSLSSAIEVGDAALPVQPELLHQLQDNHARERALKRSQRILAGLDEDLTGSKWFSEEWIGSLMNRAAEDFDAACDRWRTLYRSAVEQIDIQGKRSNDLALTKVERDRAHNLENEARRQRDLLIENQATTNSDFYSYRYLASEGFLPGYNFPRLPLSAYVPGEYGGRRDGEYLQRSRFIAISEYGPGNSIYYEGNRYRVDRVSIPTAGTQGTPLESMKVCRICGYAHVLDQLNSDVCANPICGAVLDNSFYRDNLMRMTNVVTTRVAKISSEEEERTRQGFDLKTTIQFGATDQGLDIERGDFSVEPDAIDAELIYAPAASIWRLNLGWRRRKDKTSHGFWLDMDRGRWSRSEDPENDSGQEDSDVKKSNLEKVIPYVVDRQNALIVRLTEPGLKRLGDDASVAGSEALFALGVALSRGICAEFQLEETELGVELLPEGSEPHSIILTEGSEGGAGVLHRLLEEPDAISRIARQALEICHFDPETGEDYGQAHECGVACYRCLLSYRNQRYHDELNRFLVRDILREWQRGETRTRGVTLTREAQRDELKKLTQSSLEDQFIDWLFARGYRLPDQAGFLLDDPYTRPDFYYAESRACVYVDGAPHLQPGVMDKDRQIRDKLERRGYQVIVVTFPDRWEAELAGWHDVFGSGVAR
jgi:superfamily II DNA/RNA helicase